MFVCVLFLIFGCFLCLFDSVFVCFSFMKAAHSLRIPPKELTDQAAPRPRQDHAKTTQNERHAAWETLFLQTTSATLHGSAPGGTPAAQNERHAAWEALFLKKTSATLHESAPGRPPGATRPPQDQDKTAHGKSIVFSSKILIFHWKNVGLGPKRVFYITFSGEKG